MNIATVLTIASLLLSAAALFALYRMSLALARLQGVNDKLLDELGAQQRTALAASSLHAAGLAAMQASADHTRASMAALAADLEQQNHVTLVRALGGVIEDFNTRINGQFTAHLSELNETVAASAALQDKHRAQQLDMAHHARRTADQIDRSADAFRALLAGSEQIAAIGAQLAEALALLAPRQQAVDESLAQLSQDLAAANGALLQLQERSDSAIAELGERSRRNLDALGQRTGQQQQQLAAMHKDLNDAIGKSLAALTKQVTAISSRLSSDLGPMAQQIRRVADQSKVK